MLDLDRGGAGPGMQAHEPPALAPERSLSAMLQHYMRNSPAALVFLDRRGTVLFQSEQGECLFKRWNRGLGGEGAAAALPAVLVPLMLSGSDASSLQHPKLPGLSAKLEATPEGFILCLVDLRTAGSTEALSAQALIALKKLSRSEQCIARLAVEGLKTDQIAQQISRSPRTVEFHLHCVFRKLGVRNRVQLSRLLS